MPFGDAGGIGSQADDGVARIAFDNQLAMLVPLRAMLHAVRVAGLRQHFARRESCQENQYTLRYRSSSHSLTFPMYSCHSPRLASTKRS